MRLELGSPVNCTDGPFGKLADIVVDPTKRRVTQLVVEPHDDHGKARLVPIELASAEEGERLLARMVANNQGPARAARCVGTLMPEEIAETRGLTTPLDSALRLVEQHYGSKLRQSDVASACGMTVCSFSRAFKAQFGLTFREYLLRYRIGRASELLKQKVHSATEAGFAVGFEDASHFARAFRRVRGVSPSAFVRQETVTETTATRWGMLPVAASV